MNIITNNQASWLAIFADQTASVAVKVREWRRERKTLHLHQISGARIIASLREEIRNDIRFLVTLELGRSPYPTEPKAEPTPARKWGSRQRRRTPFYRWNPNPVRNPEPVAVQ